MTQSTWFACKGAWTSSGWVDAAQIEVDSHGIILQILPQARSGSDSAGSNSSKSKVAAGTRHIKDLKGWVIPGFTNAHSHAFQYAMAGAAECRAPDRPADDFWSWRTAMYALALRLSPDELEHISTQAYKQMAMRGITSVVEFHYLHHDPAGRPYGNPAEMCERIAAAALAAGVRVTIVPVLYEQSTFGQAPLPEQRRFIHKNVDDFLRLQDAVSKLAVRYPHVKSGIGAHSLRGTKTESIKQIYAMSGSGNPFHMHVAEQPAEVEACMAHLGMRPVEWVLSNLETSSRCNLVHATHLVPKEIEDLARSNATVVICPSTEANLGDGIFPLIPFMKAGGRFALGTDSQISLDMREDLRWLEYTARLTSGKRNPLIGLSPFRKETETGELLTREIWSRGASATGSVSPSSEGLAPGQPFDAVVIDGKHPLVSEITPEKRLSLMVFATDALAIAATLVGGKIIHEVTKP